MRVSLIGFKGVGKTTLGRKLAQTAAVPFFDSDEMLVASSSFSDARESHQRLGEAGFREREREVLLDFNPSGDFVLATGGGVVTSEEIMQHLKKLGRVVYLYQSFESFFQKMQRMKPSFGYDVESLNEMWHSRAPLYTRYADTLFDVAYTSVGDIATTMGDDDGE